MTTKSITRSLAAVATAAALAFTGACGNDDGGTVRETGDTGSESGTGTGSPTGSGSETGTESGTESTETTLSE